MSSSGVSATLAMRCRVGGAATPRLQPGGRASPSRATAEGRGERSGSERTPDASVPQAARSEAGPEGSPSKGGARESAGSVDIDPAYISVESLPRPIGEPLRGESCPRALPESSRRDVCLLSASAFNISSFNLNPRQADLWAQPPCGTSCAASRPGGRRCPPLPAASCRERRGAVDFVALTPSFTAS